MGFGSGQRLETGPADKGPAGPEPSEGQDRRQRRITGGLRLLGLAIEQQILQQGRKAMEALAEGF